MKNATEWATERNGTMKSKEQAVNALSELSATATAGRRLARAVVAEARQKGTSDFWDETWSPTAHVEITLTVSEVRWAAVTLDPTLEPLLRAIERSKTP